MTRSIEYCLDTTLKALEKSWTLDKRTPLPGEELLKEFGLPNRHEFLITIIDKLIKDGYAHLIDDRGYSYTSEIDYYQNRSIITVDGYYFVKNRNSYRTSKFWKKIFSIVKFWLPITISISVMAWTIYNDTIIEKPNKAAAIKPQTRQQLNTLPPAVHSLRLDK